LIKGGEALETAHKITTIVFDKTGTITEGKPEVTDVVTAAGIEKNYLLQITASAEKGSEHPLGQAIEQGAQKQGLAIFTTERFQAITGRGIEVVLTAAAMDGSVDQSVGLQSKPEAKTRQGCRVLAGNKKLMDEKGISLAELEADSDRLAGEGKTPMYVALDGKLAGIVTVADVLKKSSKAAIESLHKMGIEVAINRVLSEVLPQDKSAEVKKLQDKGRKVAMVGDGINDAPALAQADIGIAIGSGTDVAMESADIVLMRSDLMDVPTAINLSKRTIRNIKQTLFWAFGYNVLGIPIAAAMSMSSVRY
jgi:Cu+-exporting ATPase